MVSPERKLAAVLHADVVDYSRLMGEDEIGTHRILREYLDAFAAIITKHSGRVVNTAGDAVLADFATVTEALSCAAALQRDIKTRNRALPDPRKAQFRIGINLGEVIVDRDDIYGDGVNVAARLQSLAEPGGICISGSTYDAIGNKLPLNYEFIGEQQVKNIPNPIRVYRVRLDHDGAPQTAIATPTQRKRHVSWILGIFVAVVVSLLGTLVWYYSPPHSTARTAIALPQEPSIAVLPFVNMSDDPKQEYFVDGMTEDLITDLAKLSGLFVISRNSVFTYKGEAVKVTQVAEELGVRYVLEGSVRRADDTVRINAQLIDALNGRHLWAERYDRTLDNVFALQDEVKQRIVEALAVKLSAGEQARFKRQATNDIKAYEYYLRGLKAIDHLSWDGNILAYAAFERAIKRDPNFAEAYAALALSYALDYQGQNASVLENWIRPPVQTRKRALETAVKALALEPNLAAPYLVFARLSWVDRQYDEALQHIEKAIALTPGDARVFYTHALILTSAGQHRQALDAIQKALRFEPKPPGSYYYVLGRIHFAMHNYAMAIDNLEKSGIGRPDMTLARHPLRFLAASHAHLGQIAQAKRVLKELIRGWNVSQNLTAVRLLSNAYQAQSDMDHYLQGLRLAGLPEYPYGSRPTEWEAERLRGALLERLFEKPSLTAFWRTIGRKIPVHIDEHKQLTWQGRHDFSDSSPIWIEDDQVCFQLANYFKGHRLCFMVFHNTGAALEPEYPQYQYRLIGAEEFFLSLND